MLPANGSISKTDIVISVVSFDCPYYIHTNDLILLIYSEQYKSYSALQGFL